MIRRPPRSTRTDTLFPYTTPFRSLCLVEILALLAATTFPALLPTFLAEWRMSNTEAGWISGIYYGGYVAAVPVLTSLTDRMDARRILFFALGLSAVSALGFAFQIGRAHV